MARAFKYYYDFMSPPSRALWITFKLGKTQFQDCPVALRKFEQMTDEYKRINRFQKVPALVDGDFHLSESTAMLRYLSSKGEISEQLYPKSLRERAKVDEFLGWQAFNLRLHCWLYYMHGWLLPMNGWAAKPSDEKIEEYIKNIDASLQLFESLWLDKSFLTGDRLTVADLNAVVDIEQLKLCNYNVNEERFPLVTQWLARVRETANPYYDEAHNFIYKYSKQNPMAKL